MTDIPESVACIAGGPTDANGVCLEHGETACVVTLWRADDDTGHINGGSVTLWQAHEVRRDGFGRPLILPPDDEA